MFTKSYGCLIRRIELAVMRQYVVRLSDCPSVRLSVTFRYCDHIGSYSPCKKVASRTTRKLSCKIDITAKIWKKNRHSVRSITGKQMYIHRKSVV